MAHFVKIVNGLVVEGVVVHNNVLGEPSNEYPNTESLGQAFITDTLGLPGEWLQTSYNGNFRKQYAGPGYRYDAAADVFIAPQPFPSWTLDANHDWQAPTPMPSEGGPWRWDEDTLSWVEVTA